MKHGGFDEIFRGGDFGDVRFPIVLEVVEGDVSFEKFVVRSGFEIRDTKAAVEDGVAPAIDKLSLRKKDHVGGVFCVGVRVLNEPGFFEANSQSVDGLPLAERGADAVALLFFKALIGGLHREIETNRAGPAIKRVSGGAGIIDIPAAGVTVRVAVDDKSAGGKDERGA